MYWNNTRDGSAADQQSGCNSSSNCKHTDINNEVDVCIVKHLIHIYFQFKRISADSGATLWHMNNTYACTVSNNIPHCHVDPEHLALSVLLSCQSFLF